MAEQKKAPVVRARNRGQITRTLERYADAYRASHPGMVSRYVYDPQHKTELSKVTSREADGYKKVRWKELPKDVWPEETDPEALVRVADLILMRIDTVTARELAQANVDAATDQMHSVQRGFRDEIAKAEQAHHSPEHTRPGMSPIGSATIALKEFSYDVEQPDSTKDT